MCGPATAFGVATAATGAASALGNYQQGRAQTDATNQMRKNTYRDQLAMNQYAYNKDMGVYQQSLADYQAGLNESEQALGKSFTQLDKRAAERIAAARFAGQTNLAQDIASQGKLAASLPAGGSRNRAMALDRGRAGMRDANVEDYLLRSRYGDIDVGNRLIDQANSLRRQLASRVGPAPVMGPMPSAPVMQAGPSALSLIGGLGSAAIGGFSAGRGLAKDLGRA